MQPAKKIFSNLKKKINNTSAKIAVVGLGYVGLPIVNLIQKKKYNVIGFDVDEKKINLLKKKKKLYPILKVKFFKKS
jgi:UDP-N-acetyl-D-glucosamine dehydrogenase